MAVQFNVGHGLLILDEVFYITHNDAPQSVELLWTSDQFVAETSTWQHTTFTTDKRPCPRWDSNPHAPVGFELTITAGERPQTNALSLYYKHKFDVHLTVHRDKFLIIKPIRCTNSSNLFLEWKSTCFGEFACPTSGVFHCTHSSGICYTTCEQDQDGTAVPFWSCSQAVSKPVWHKPLLCVQWKTPDDGQRNCQKHVEFQYKNKFEELVHLVGFIIRKLQAHFSPKTPDEPCSDGPFIGNYQN